MQRDIDKVARGHVLLAKGNAILEQVPKRLGELEEKISKKRKQ